MMLGPGFAVLLFLSSSFAHSSDSFKFSTLPSGGLKVNCISHGLKQIPTFPADTAELHLQHNELSTVPAGHFDAFKNLRMANLSENPFHCGCNIRYLRAWLLRNKAVTPVTPKCASPPSLAHKAIVELSEKDFSACVQDPCSEVRYNFTVAFMLCVLIGLLFWCFRLAKDLTFTLGIGERHVGLEAESLRSLKPKHRMRMSFAAGSSSSRGDELERPLLNMEILPQIIDALHRQHNIKIKET
ncbi:glycoprotein IX (platelet) [Colossoma macropomum]|uniref:glycoprotein IX (platelet) n=1 Tax=Colossoma macropomum TaxID=42526 RepID=UPI001863C758|nr:glycoprotein IX (platelet) [Colossoma macropomum]